MNILINRLAAGDTAGVISELLKTENDSTAIEEITIISNIYENLMKEKMLGIISYEQEKLEINKINNKLLNILNKEPSPEVSNKDKTKSQKNIWQRVIKISIVFVLFGSIYEILNFINLVPGIGYETAQLTIYIHGNKNRQDVILQNTGKLIIDFGNDRRVAMIGENGRTNFGEIPKKFIGSYLTIGIDALGYKSANADSLYIMDGTPIYLKVIKDESKRKIYGAVKNRKGDEFIKDAMIYVNNDTVTTTDKMGKFFILLPEDFEKEKYKLTVLKDGYKAVEEYYYPNTQIEIRLEKK